MKFAVVALALVALFALGALGQSHNVNWGTVAPRDQLIHREIVQKKSKILQIVEGDFTFPPKGQSNIKNISAIKVLDQYTNGKGGYATLKNGGAGYKNVGIHFKSQRGHGFNFIVEIYG